MSAQSSDSEKPKRRHRNPAIRMQFIRKFAREVATRFHPDTIYLFGSCASGAQHEDSDVDILVVMPCRNRINQAVEIRWQIPVPFSMDLLVCTPRQMAEQLKQGDSFLTEIVNAGKVLYEKSNQAMGAKSRTRLRIGKRNRNTEQVS
jgi:predicted nucleotidyltransferase